MSSGVFADRVAMPMAAAVLRGDGSRMMVAIVCARCSWWDSAPMIVGGLNRSGALHLSSVSCRGVLSLWNGMNCFGRSGVERGHRRVPCPPARMIGVILCGFVVIGRRLSLLFRGVKSYKRFIVTYKDGTRCPMIYFLTM